jgi:23S rRNA (adenine2503-C2)-methyltransferase
VRQKADDGTCKLLIRLGDGKTVEAVMMPDYRDDRAAGCVSSQVGCAMGCDFCATTKTGYERNLTSGEIVEQFLALRRRGAGRREAPADAGLHGHG